MHSKRYRITISMNDNRLIEFLRSNYSPKKKLYKYKNTRGNGITYTFITTNEYDIEFIKQMGINERKSLTLKFPSIDKTYINSMIRGIFDGDGSVYINRTKSNNKYYEQVNASFTTGSEEFADSLLEILIENNINAHKIKELRIEKNTWYVKIYSKDDVRRLYEYMYKDCVLYMKRKKDLFNMMIQSKLKWN